MPDEIHMPVISGLVAEGCTRVEVEELHSSPLPGLMTWFVGDPRQRTYTFRNSSQMMRSKESLRPPGIRMTPPRLLPITSSSSSRMPGGRPRTRGGGGCREEKDSGKEGALDNEDAVEGKV